MFSARGSTAIIIAAILGFALIVISAIVWGKLFVTSEGIDTPQINTYNKAIDSANKIEQQVQSPSYNKTYEDLNKLQNKIP